MPKHDFYTDKYGDVDVWRMESDYHNGPQCRRCGAIECMNCNLKFLTEDCESNQIELF